MKFKLIIVGLFAIIGGFIFLERKNSPPLHAEHPRRAATVYKTETCGCCANYLTFLRAQNYEVEEINLTQEELTQKKHDLGVPHQLNSCHTTVVKEQNYFIEGHIPYEAIDKLLAEKPDIKGIGMPGMPSASPGMPGTKTEPFIISQVYQDSTTGLYLTL